jgi:hypothetical protein
MANPYMASDHSSGVSYSDPTLYSKSGLQSFLEGRYSNSIAALNTAWRTSYTTWGTSNGSIAQGTNAYGSGSGFMDENGRNILNTCSNLDYNHTGWTNNATIRKDLDDFVTYWSNQYGQALAAAINAVLTSPNNRPPILVPLYTGPDQAYKAITPYIDGFWTNPGESTDGTTYSFDPNQTAADVSRILADTNKPIIIADYGTAQQGTQIGFTATITGVSYSSSSGQTTITAENAPYWLGAGVSLSFPDSNTHSCPSENPILISVIWSGMSDTTLVISGNYSSCLAAGQSIQPWCGGAPGNCPDDLSSESDLSAAEIERFNAVENLPNGNQINAVVGFEWWDLWPEELVSWNGNPGAFGFLTYNDNLFDGDSDGTAVGTDANGFVTGGEEANYGNRLEGSGMLGPYLNGIYGNLQ